jgi:molybdopterin-guanine dinucleotide biosynthesis protein A
MNILILAGGRSSRFGRDKRLVDLGGVTLLGRTLRIVEGLELPVFLATTADDGALGCWPRVARLHDRIAGSGPLATLIDALDRLGQDLLCLAADMPELSRETLDRLLQIAASHPDATAIVPRSERGLDPLCAVYRPAALPALQERFRTGERGLQAALANLEGVIEVPAGALGSLSNLNRAVGLPAARFSVRPGTDVP